MDYDDLVRAIEHYGGRREDLFRMFLGFTRERIQESVIIAPWWEPKVFAGIAGNAEFLGQSANVRGWNLNSAGRTITYIKTGIGAPLVMDVVLTLGQTECKQLLFVGSVGALDADMAIGDVVIPEYSVCGDGASRYLAGNNLMDVDPFGEKSYPDKKLYEDLKRCVEGICPREGVKHHIGRVFSIDTIFAQFAHLNEILEMGCNVIEMETAAAFRAAKLANIPMAALFSVSDNTVTRKSLVGARPKGEMQYRKEVRSKVFPEIWEMLFEVGSVDIQ